MVARSRVGVKLPATGIPDSVEGILARVAIGEGDGVTLGAAELVGVGLAVGVGVGVGEAVGVGVGLGVGLGVLVAPEGVDSKPGSPSAACTVNVRLRLLKNP